MPCKSIFSRDDQDFPTTTDKLRISRIKLNRTFLQLALYTAFQRNNFTKGSISFAEYSRRNRENSKIVEISKFYESTGSHGRKPPIEFRLRSKRKFTKNSSSRFDNRFLSLISPLSALHRSFLSAIILITSVPARLNINILSSHHSRSTHRISFLRIFPFTTCSVDKHAGRERIKKSEEAKKRFGSRSDRGAGMERERGSRLRNLLARDCRLNCQVKTQHLSTCTGAHREPPDWYLER